MSKRQASIFVLGAVVVLSAIDLALALDNIPSNTYSERIREWGYSFRWIPFVIAACFGALLTHWFAKPYDKEETTDPGTPNAFRARSRRERLIIAGSLLLTVAAGMGIGLFW